MAKKTFDVDAWLKKATPQTIEVRVNGAGAEAAERVALIGEYEQLKDSPRVGSSRRIEIKARVAELEEIIEASTLVLTLRSLEGEKRDRIEDSHPVPPRPELPEEPTAEDEKAHRELVDARSEAIYRRWYALISAACLSPEMTPEQVRQMRSVIGEAQWSAVVDAVEGLTANDLRDVPFSPLPSDDPSTE